MVNSIKCVIPGMPPFELCPEFKTITFDIDGTSVAVVYGGKRMTPAKLKGIMLKLSKAYGE